MYRRIFVPGRNGRVRSASSRVTRHRTSGTWTRSRFGRGRRRRDVPDKANTLQTIGERGTKERESTGEPRTTGLGPRGQRSSETLVRKESGPRKVTQDERQEYQFLGLTIQGVTIIRFLQDISLCRNLFRKSSLLRFVIITTN